MLMFILATTEIAVLTFENLIMIVIAIATVLGSITVIINFAANIKSRNKKNIKSVIDEELSCFSKETDVKVDKAFVEVHNRTNNKIDALSNKLESFIVEDKEYKTKKDKELTEVLTLLKNANIEVYKNDIRKVYYNLRETGEITDYSKEYVDALFPVYKALGGNSDIEAKYTEICEFYSKVTKENFDKARAKKRTKKQDKPVDKEDAEDA